MVLAMGVVLSGTGLLILAEMACRFLGLGAPPPAPNPQIYAPDAKIGCRLKANWTGTYTGVTVQTNSHGLRGHELGQRSPKRKRVVLSGDSFTFGYGLPEEETLRSWLEKGTAGGLEVVNGAVPGYSLVQDVSWSLEVGLSLEPDYLLVVVVPNDLEDPRYFPGRASEATPPRNWVEFIQGDPRPLNLPGARSIRLVSLCQRMLKALLPSQHSLNAMFFDFYNRALFETPNWTAAKNALARLREVASARGIDLAIVLYPVPVNFMDYPLAPFHTRLTDACKELGIPVMDPTESWKNIPAPSLRWHPDDLHPNGKANRLMAEFIRAEWDALNVPAP